MAVFRCQRIKKQNKPRRAVSHIGGKGRYPVIPIQIIRKPRHNLFRFLDGCAGRKVHVKNDFRPYGIGEVLLVHKRNKCHCSRKNRCRAYDNRLFETDAPGDCLIKQSVSPVRKSGFLFSRYHPDETIPQNRTYKDGCHPGKKKRRSNDPKKGSHIFRCLPRGKTDRDKTRCRDKRPGQHRFRTSFIRRLCCRQTIHPFFQFDLHHFNHDNRVIYK